MRRFWAASMSIWAAALPALAVHAQTRDPPLIPVPEDTDDGQAIIVTGSRLRIGSIDRPSPTEVVRREEFVLTGVPNVEQTLNQLPQLVAGFTNTSNNPGTGAATLDLRGLGSVRTLILVNGRRWIASDAGEVPEVDVNTIPAALIERVDIVTGGGSAVYGSDAVTGVINFILRDDLEGLRLDARQNLTERGDGRVSSADLSFGSGFANDQGRLVASVGWLDQASILQGDRKLARVALTEGCTVPGTRAETGASKPVPGPNCASPNELGFIAGGSPIIPGSRIIGPAFFPVSGSNQLQRNIFGLRFDPDGTPRPFNFLTDAYNYAPANYLQIPFERWSANLAASFAADEAVEPYTELAYVRTVSTQQLAPVPAALLRPQISLANPFLTPEAAQVLELSFGIDASGRRGFIGSPATGFRINPAFGGDADGIIVLPAFLQSRLDLGPRRRRNERDAWRILAGLRGEIGPEWSGDVYYSRSHVEHLTEAENSGSAARLRQALLAVRSPSGEIVCLDPSNGCVPANIFGAGNLSQEAADFIATDPTDLTIVEEEIAEAIVRRAYDFRLAAPIGLAAGISWRRTAFSFAPDPSLFTGDDLGFQPGTPAAGSTSAFELFGEARLPLLADQPLAREVTVELGLRWSNYESSGSAWTWKALGEWSPIRPLRLRGGYQRAVRAPNVRELFEQPTTLIGPVLDPCSASLGLLGNAEIVTACLRDGVPAGALGSPLESATIVTRRGNPDVNPEIARTMTIGGIFSLDRPRVTLAVDYYDIEIEGPVGVFGGGPGGIIFGCIVGGAKPDDPLCEAYERGPDGAVATVQTPTANLDRLLARGIDWQLAWREGLPGGGVIPPSQLSIRLSGTRYFENSFRSSSNLPELDCAGLFGGACGNTIRGTATPRWKLYNQLSWSPGPTTLTIRHRWFSATMDSRGPQALTRGLPPPPVPDEGLFLESRHYFDLGVTIRASDRLQLTFGINNFTDEEPALTALGVQANTDPSLYDVLGRRFFAALTLHLGRETEPD